MNAKARTARQICKARRDAAKAHRVGLHTVTSHALRAGLAPEIADGIGNAVRAKAKKLGVCGHTALMVRRTAEGVRPVKGAKRYSKAEFAVMLDGYRPRLPKYVAAKALLAAYAAA